MELSHFISNAASVLEQSQSSVIVFQGSAYSHIFFMQLFNSLKAELTLDFKTIDMQSGEFAYKSQLSSSFLGMNCLYWLADVATLKPKQKDDLMHFIASYQGPHKIILFIDTKTNIKEAAHLTLITMKDKYFFQDAKSLWVSQDSQQMQKIAFFLHEMYKIKNSFTLDELCLLKNYQDLITHDTKKFYASWVTRLVVPDTSLFTLSQLLFEKKEEAFFRLWLEIKPLYADMFWIAYWSDQLYKSYFFIAFTQQENFAAVKQVSFGLSFSFMKQSYKQYQLGELQNFHHALFAVDTALKSGGNSYQIDQLFIEFFAGRFKN